MKRMNNIALPSFSLVAIIILSIYVSILNRKRNYMRDCYNSVTISLFRNLRAIKNEQEFEQFVEVVKKSEPRMIKENPGTILDFGFVRDSSGTWKIVGQ